MTDRTRIVGGPMDGRSVGDWDEYPDRIVFEYDCVRNPRAIDLIPAGLPLIGADRLIAEYDLDRGWNTYSFSGWTVQRIPPSPAPDS